MPAALGWPSSPRRTNGRPAWCSPPSGAMRSSTGLTSGTRSSSRTTTTPSSATTGSPSVPCRVYRRTGSFPSGRSASRSRRRCGSAGAALPPLPPAPTEPVRAAKRVADRGAPVVDQLALVALIESGRYDRHLRRMRTEYSKRRETLVAALAEHAPRARLTGLAAGFHAVAHLPDGADEADVVARALSKRVALYGMGRYRSTHATRPPQLVIGFGNTGVRAIEDGIKTVAALLR